MGQYDQFIGMFPTTTLPSRGRGITSQKSKSTESPHREEHGVHPGLRRLSTGRPNRPRCCSSCHLRLPSQEHLPALIRHDSTSSEEWDGFCPDITMPKDTTISHSPTRHFHQRRHSGLCPRNVSHHERKSSIGSPIQMLAKEHADTLNHDKCNCETIIPQDNLSERYGLVEEPQEIRRKRDSLDQEAASQLAEIMHQELMSDMEARQCLL